MIAALPMYDLPWLRCANDRLWSLLAQKLQERGVEGVPTGLRRSGNISDNWTSPELLLGQTCGYPLVTHLKASVQLVATPHYAAEGCEGAFHSAAIVVRRDDPYTSIRDLCGARAGINDAGSNTGMNLFRAAIAHVSDGPDFFGSVTVTRSHARSVAAILSGTIDVAAIDAVTLALLKDRYPGQADALRIIDWTAPSPALPLITAIGTPAWLIGALRSALSAIGADPENRPLLDRLRINGFSSFTLEDYHPVLAFEQGAIARGYPTLN